MVWHLKIFLFQQTQIPLEDQLSVLHLGPDMEQFKVKLAKDILGLGITIAGYISDKSVTTGKLFF